MKFFENKRTPSKREIYICGIRILTRERGKATATRKHNESLVGYEAKLEQAKKYLTTAYAPLPPKKDLPENTVWQLWFQGEENAPILIRKCLSSVQHHTNGRPYVLLTRENLSEYLDIPDFIMQKYETGKIGVAHFSDIIRLLLLAQYGGTWIDATVLLTSPIPKRVENAAFFVFKSPDFCLYPNIPKSGEFLRELNPVNNPYICCSNWFIHSDKGCPVTCTILASLLEHWKKEDKAIDYFVMHYLITLTILSVDTCRHIFTEMPSIGNHYPHLLQNMLDFDYNGNIFDEICTVSFAHKLTHRLNAEAFSPESYYNHLIADRLSIDENKVLIRS